MKGSGVSVCQEEVETAGVKATCLKGQHAKHVSLTTHRREGSEDWINLRRAWGHWIWEEAWGRGHQDPGARSSSNPAAALFLGSNDLSISLGESNYPALWPSTHFSVILFFSLTTMTSFHIRICILKTHWTGIV